MKYKYTIKYTAGGGHGETLCVGSITIVAANAFEAIQELSREQCYNVTDIYSLVREEVPQ